MGTKPCTSPRRTVRRWAAALAATVGLTAVAPATADAALEQPTSPNSGAACANGVQANDLNDYFSKSNAGMYGADYQRAYPLPDGRVLWMFQDVFLQVGYGQKLVHNAGLIQSGRCFTLLKGPSNSEWLLWDVTNRYNRWWWPMGGEVNPSTGHFELLMAEMRDTGTGYLGSATRTWPEKMWRVTIRLSDLRVLGYTPAPDSSQDLFGWATASDNEWTYLFSHCYRQFGWDGLFGSSVKAHDRSCTGNVKVARVPKGRLDLAPTYWNGYQWTGNRSSAINVMPGDRTINPVDVMFDGQQWVSISKVGDWFGKTIYLDHAPSPVGPWTTYHQFDPATKCADCNTYYASWVPWRNNDGSLIAGLSHNRWDGVKSSVYRPSFFSVPAPPSYPRTTAPDVVAPSASSKFNAVTPCRLLDTRKTPGRPGTDWYTEVQVTGRCGIGTNASAAAVTITAVAADGHGHAVVYPKGQTTPNVSNLNYGPGEIRANSAVVRVGDGGKISVFVKTGTHLVIDVSGAWTPAATSRDGRFVAYGPTRLIDTRKTNSPMRAGGVLRVPLPSGVPADATAVAVTLTATQSSDRGHFTAYRAGSSRPNASVLNLDAAGQTRAATTIVPVNGNGFDIYAHAGSHMIVDITGYYTGGSATATTSGLFVADNPARLVDTRRQGPSIAPSGIRTVNSGVNASAVVVNVTAVKFLRPGFYTAYPAGMPRPNTSTVNPSNELAVANMAIVGLNGGSIDVFSLPGGDLVVDRAGWFL